jgi:ArsR family transcriptional regulator
VSATSAPLHHSKAELFRTLGHPVRIRVLELLEDRPMAVRELLADIEVESSSLSQQLAGVACVAVECARTGCPSGLPR